MCCRRVQLVMPSPMFASWVLASLWFFGLFYSGNLDVSNRPNGWVRVNMTTKRPQLLAQFDCNPCNAGGTSLRPIISSPQPLEEITIIYERCWNILQNSLWYLLLCQVAAQTKKLWVFPILVWKKMKTKATNTTKKEGFGKTMQFYWYNSIPLVSTPQSSHGPFMGCER